MREIGLQLPLEVIGLWRFASKDVNRENITGVRIEVADGKMTAVATCGHRLGRVIVPAVGVRSNSPFACTIPASVLKSSEALAKKDIVLLSCDADGQGAATVGVINTVLIAGTFPKWEQVIARGVAAADAKPVAVGFNANYVGDCGAYMKAVGFGGQGLQLEPVFDAQCPMHLTSAPKSGIDFLGVIMPMRM